MSGGVAFVYDQDGQFALRCNTEQVVLEPLLDPTAQAAAGIPLHAQTADETLLKGLLEEHLHLTGSLRAEELLANWATAKKRFIKVFPHEYRRALEQINAAAQAAAPVIASVSC
jgi:glutamate synthase domain-containing protein 3